MSDDERAHGGARYSTARAVLIGAVALLRVILAAISGLGLAAPVASAATVFMEQAPAPLKAFYVADPGERNRLVVAYDAPADGGVTVHDPAAAVHAVAPCTSIDASTAHCPAPPVPGGIPRIGGYDVTLYADLGDRGDELAVSGALNPQAGVFATGGSGADNLIGGDGPDQLDGGSEPDKVTGGNGSDFVSGGNGLDADRLDGGAGEDDFVSYRTRAAGVTVDLAAGTGGEAAEADVLIGVEGAEGGAGGDTIYGDDLGNSVLGHEGDDTLDGRGGADKVDGGDGADVVGGGDGSDLIIGGGESDAFECGSSTDEVIFPSAGEILGRDCEQVDFDRSEFGSFRFRAHPVERSRRAVTFLLPCPTYDEETERPCRATLKLREAAGDQRLLGRAVWTAPRPIGRPREIRVRLTAAGRRLAARRRGVLTTASFRDTKGRTKVGWTIPLRIR